MKDYVQFGSLMAPPPPFTSHDVRLRGFWAEADADKLDRLCDRLFRHVTEDEVVIKAIGRHVMITWGTIPRVDSQTAPYDAFGGVSEPQVVIWIPAVLCDPDDGGGLRARRFGFVVPFIWVDNAMSLACGREVFGYPKAWGWFDSPELGGPDGRWGLDVYGLDYAPSSIAARHQLMEITEGDDLPGGPESEIEGLLDLARKLVGQLFDDDEVDVLEGDKVAYGIRFARDLLADLRTQSFPQFFLKQIRDIADGTQACLTQVTQCWYDVADIRARPVLKEHTLRVRSLSSHPVVEELGLRDQTLHVAYDVTMRFDVGRGEVLWDAAAAPAATPVG